MRKLALLSMDVEDWYHLEYFERPERADWSMLDGLDNFANFLDDASVPGTFFCLGELASSLRARLTGLVAAGHEIASHGPDHALPTRQNDARFGEEMRRHKAHLEDVVGRAVTGYRAPCFAMDDSKLDILANAGFAYDSSFVNFPAHPLYGRMDLSGWETVRSGVRRSPAGSILEFEIPVSTVLGRTVPVAGGAYFRIFPWAVTASLLRKELANRDVYVFYIHPFECSTQRPGRLPAGTRWSTRARFSLGRNAVLGRLERLVRLLRHEGFEFATFSQAMVRI